jgi:hypothetical protein
MLILIELLLEGYSQIEILINEVDVILHMFKHKTIEEINAEQFHNFILQLIEVMEYEIEIFNDTIVSDKSSFATKYFLIEKLHIDNNKIHDLYSETKYPHRMFNLSFEKTRGKPSFKPKANNIKNDSDYILNYYNMYLEESLKIKMETRFDYDSYLSELFPNHDQHVEYMILILYLLSQFCSNENLQKKIILIGQTPEDQKIMEEKMVVYKKRITILMMC